MLACWHQNKVHQLKKVVIKKNSTSEQKVDSTDEHQCVAQEALHYEGSRQPCSGELESLDDLAAQAIPSENSYTEGIVNMADLVPSRVRIFDWQERDLQQM